MNHNHHNILVKKCEGKVTGVQLFLVLSLVPFLTACSQQKIMSLTITPILTEIQSTTPKPAITLTATPTRKITITPAVTTSSTPIASLSKSSSPTATPKPFLISYSFYQDGGDDLGICMRGVFQPTFILYKDGQLIFLRNLQYWQAFLSQDEITELFNLLSNTGLFLHSEEEYQEGNSVLEINSRIYRAAWNIPLSDPLYQAIEIITNYQPGEIQRYDPETILLEIYSSYPDFIDYVRKTYPQSTTFIGNWDNDPISKYGEVWEIITGKDVTFIMSQFAHFPDFKILKSDDKYYIASICANIP